MKKHIRVFVFVVESFLLAAIIYLEKHPNAYAERLLFIGRVWALFFAVVTWACFLGFVMGVPSPRVANNAVRMKGMSIFKRIAILQDFAIAIVSLAVGRWWFFICYFFHLTGGAAARHAARLYLQRVKIDKDAKHAVIDVN